jgi:site-specific DNA-methyltransferase (adenine-specific)
VIKGISVDNSNRETVSAIAGDRREVLADGVELYLGDCRSILPTLGNVDHVITDPPYEQLMHDLHESVKLRRNDGGSERKALGFAGINEIRDDVIAAVRAVNNGWLLAFCNVEGVWHWRSALMAAGLKFKTTCIWVKPDATPKLNGQGPALAYECITTTWCGKGHSRWNGGGKRGVFSHLTNNTDRTGEHPTEKPLNLMLELVTLFSNVGECVVDPFMGSGTTGVACVRSGRGFVGIEIDQNHFDLACRRIEAATKQSDMFIEKPKPATQVSFADLWKAPYWNEDGTAPA